MTLSCSVKHQCPLAGHCQLQALRPKASSTKKLQTEHKSKQVRPCQEFIQGMDFTNPLVAPRNGNCRPSATSRFKSPTRPSSTALGWSIASGQKRGQRMLSDGDASIGASALLTLRQILQTRQFPFNNRTHHPPSAQAFLLGVAALHQILGYRLHSLMQQ